MVVCLAFSVSVTVSVFVLLLVLLHVIVFALMCVFVCSNKLVVTDRSCLLKLCYPNETRISKDTVSEWKVIVSYAIAGYGPVELPFSPPSGEKTRYLWLVLV